MILHSQGLRLDQLSKLTECILGVMVSPMISQSLTVLASRIAQNTDPLIITFRISFCFLFFQPMCVVLQVLVLVEILLPRIGSTAYLARI